jgi:ABC-2 type transport system permease protein
MIPIIAIIKREFKTSFSSLSSCIFLLIYLILSNFLPFTVSNFFEIESATMDTFFYWQPWLFAVLIPTICMPLWADERSSGTMELLATLPIPVWKAVLGKFLAAWLFMIIALIFTLPFMGTVAYLGCPDYGVILCAYIGLVLLAGSFIAISCAMSALTKSQVSSFILSALVGLFLILAGWTPLTKLLINWAPKWILDLGAWLGVLTHFYNIQRGVIDSRDCIYFLSLIVSGLFLNKLILQSHRAR